MRKIGQRTIWFTPSRVEVLHILNARPPREYARHRAYSAKTYSIRFML